MARTYFLLSLVLCGFALQGFAHEGLQHDPVTPGQLQIQEAKWQQVRIMYTRGPEQIFRQKCFDCHSSQTQYPWYYPVPGIKQLIDDDIHDAKKHIDMTNGFPFAGPHTISEQLKGLHEEVIEENDMPPLLYRLIHWSSKLTEAEKATVNEWITRSQQLLQQETK